ncbi:MAG: HepT-like ribonuclease domain-containing protein [Thermodesulfobacteriota bacterium]
MRPDVRDQGYLLDMLQHARGVTAAVEGLTLEKYVGNETVRLAVERRIEIIGEAARRVSAAFQEAHPEIPWRKIVAQRHVLAHEYGEIEDEIVWHVATVSIPALIQLLSPLVSPPDDAD